MFTGLDSVDHANDLLSGDKDRADALTFESATRIQDMESRIPRIPSPTSDDVPLAFLKDDALMEEVIAKVNELIKRDLKYKRVE